MKLTTHLIVIASLITSIIIVVVIVFITNDKEEANNKDFTEKKLILNRRQKIKQLKMESEKIIAAAKRVLRIHELHISNERLKEIEELKRTLEEIHYHVKEMNLEIENLQVKEREIKELNQKLQETIIAIERNLVLIKEQLPKSLQEYDFLIENLAAAERMLVLLKELSEHRLQGQEIEALKGNLKHIDDIVTGNQLEEMKALKSKLEVIKQSIDELKNLQKLLEKKESETYEATTAIERKLTSLKKLSVNKLKEIVEYNLRLEDSDAGRNENNTFGDEVTIVQKTVTGGKPDTIAWPDRSFKMEIPPGSFPDEQDINISVSLDPSHQMETPEGYKSVSQAYKITASEKLQDSVIITLKHNGVITSIEEASSVTVLHQSEEGTVEVLQGTAAVNSSFVVFQLSQLSWIKIVAAVNISVNYSMTFHRLEVSGTAGQYWTIRLLLSPKNKTLSGWIIDSLHEHIVPSITVKDEPIQMKIKPIGCWTIPSVTADTIKVPVNNREVDSSGDFTMEWRHDCTDPVSFIRLYDTEGASMYEIFKNPDDIRSVTVSWNSWNMANIMYIGRYIGQTVVAIGLFSIFIWFRKNLSFSQCLISFTCFAAILIACCNVLEAYKYYYDSAAAKECDCQQVGKTDKCSTARDSCSAKHQKKFASQLEITQLEEVMQALRDSNLDNTKWKSVGLSLGLYDHTLSAIKDDSNDVEECFHKTLSLWLRRADGVEKKGGATWSSLAKALHDNNENAVAARIEENHLNYMYI